MNYRQTMTHKLDVFEFGKFKGKSVRHVIENEPSYILWLDTEKIVKFSKEIIDNAEDNNHSDCGDLSDGDGWDGDVQD